MDVREPLGLQHREEEFGCMFPAWDRGKPLMQLLSLQPWWGEGGCIPVGMVVLGFPPLCPCLGRAAALGAGARSAVSVRQKGGFYIIPLFKFNVLLI